MTTLGGVFCDLYSLGIRGDGNLGVDNANMQSICTCYVQSIFSSKLFHNLSLNFGGVQLQCCHGRL